MSIVRTFKPEALPIDEIVELLATLLAEPGSSGDDVATLASLPPVDPAQSDLLSPAPGVSNGHDQ